MIVLDFGLTSLIASRCFAWECLFDPVDDVPSVLGLVRDAVIVDAVGRTGCVHGVDLGQQFGG